MEKNFEEIDTILFHGPKNQPETYISLGDTINYISCSMDGIESEHIKSVLTDLCSKLMNLQFDQDKTF